MNSLLQISHPEILPFSQWQAPGHTEEASGRVISWQSPEMESPGLLSCVGVFETLRSFNSIRIQFHPEHRDFFPNTFRFEISSDGVVWEPILHEANFRGSSAQRGEWHFSLISAKMVKFLFLADRTTPVGKYLSAFGEFSVMVSGIVQLDVSSELDRLWVKENLIDKRADYGWSTALRVKPQVEHIHLDLGAINRVGEIRLLSKNDRETLFPESFRIGYSEDHITYHHLIEEAGFLAEPGTWYRWRFLPTNIRFLRLEITEGARTREGKYVSQIIELELYAVPDLVDKTEKSMPEPIPYASVLRSGVMRFGTDGEVKEGVAVQASDRRLKDATTETRGIVELASDGEVTPGVAVQGSDRRLKYATEDLPGILRLARDGETRASHAVQGNDRRLRLATEDDPGLVELAFDGENRPGVAVQANDSRIKLASEKSAGIVKLAQNGTKNPGEAVQGDDARLKDASELTRGIVRLARAGEEAPDTAVQGSDPRLKLASTETPGIVELARHGESKEGAALQSSDARLAPATESSPGIVELCAPGANVPRKVVQGNDPRLTDARTPIPHKHDYAPLDHDFASHSGLIQMKAETGKSYQNIAPPPENHAPVLSRNSGGGSGIAGIAEQDGVIGAGKVAGVAGYGLGDGKGILGLAQSASGGTFVSSKNYSLVAGGSERGVNGSPYALLAKGMSSFEGTICASADDAVIACFFKTEKSDVYTSGDLVTCSKQDFVKKTKSQMEPVIGIVTGSASIILNPPEGYLPPSGEKVEFQAPRTPEGMVLVAIAGIARVRVSADKQPVKAGDLLCASGKAGFAEKLSPEKHKPGTVFGRSLEDSNKGDGIIRCLISLI